MKLRHLIATLAGITGVAGSASAMDADWQAAVQMKPYVRTFSDHARTFVFDGSENFVNPQGVNDLATAQFNGQTLVPFGNDFGSDTHITKVLDIDNVEAISMVVRPSDAPSKGTAYRTQLNSFFMEMGKTYIVDVDLRIGAGFLNSSSSQDGLFWQLKTDGYDNQHPNPAVALVLKGDQLTVNFMYPKLVDGKVPTAWTSKDMVAKVFPAKTVVTGKAYRLRFMFATDDQPAELGGKGFFTASIDGAPWVSYAGPTVLPYQASEPRISFGWYQWNGPAFADRTVLFRKHSVFTVENR